MTTYEEAVEQGFDFDDVNAVYFEIVQFQDVRKQKPRAFDDYWRVLSKTEKGRKEIRETLNCCDVEINDDDDLVKDIEDPIERLEVEMWEQQSDPALVESVCDWNIAEFYKTDEQKKEFLEYLKKEYPPEDWYE